MFSKLISGLLVCAFVTGCATTNNSSVDAKRRIKFTQQGNDVAVTVDNDILFGLADASLTKESGPVLDVLVSDSLSRTKKNLSIEGHTDSRGTEALNKNLSKQRAEAVKTALVARGILSARIATEGYGPTRPVVQNAKSEDEHQKNRRAVILIKDERVENVRSSKLEEGFDYFIKSLGLK